MTLSINQRLGRKIKQLRIQRGLSQIELAERMDVSFQQIQKYEKGTTKIYVSRLQELANALGVKLEIFTKEIEEISCISDVKVEYSPDSKNLSEILPDNKEEKSLLQLFRKIKSEKLRKGVIKLLKGIVELESHG